MAKIHAILRRYHEIEKAVIYGSRAKGNYREGSDIDLTLFGNINTKTIADVLDALDESFLPYTFDISAYDSLKNDKLREHIDRVGKEFYRREEDAGVGAGKGWEQKKLGDVCIVIAGQSPEGKYYNNVGNGTPFYQGKKEFGERFISEPTTWTTEITKEALAGDILMSVRAPVGPVNFSTKKICIGRGLAAIRPGKGIEPEYLFNFLVKQESEIVGNAGAVFPSINKSQIESITIPLPPLPEQKRIVAILDEAFSGISRAKEIAEKNLANSREIFNSYLKSLFTNPGAQWSLKNLSSISIEFGRGKSRHRPRGDSKILGGSYPLIQTGDVGNSSHWIKSYTQTYNEMGLAQSKLWPRGTVCIAIVGANVGETAILDFDACFPDSVIGIIVDEKKANNEYVEYLLQSFKAFLKECGKGTARDNINMATFENQNFPFPSLKVQVEIVSKLNRLAAETKNLESIYQKKLSNLDLLKTALLRKAFSGALTGTAS
jgi:type I restriction enzyme S subunit